MPGFYPVALPDSTPTARWIARCGLGSSHRTAPLGATVPVRPQAAPRTLRGILPLLMGLRGWWPGYAGCSTEISLARRKKSNAVGTGPFQFFIHGENIARPAVAWIR